LHLVGLSAAGPPEVLLEEFLKVAMASADVHGLISLLSNFNLL
jgi:hypothetical protein